MGLTGRGWVLARGLSCSGVNSILMMFFLVFNYQVFYCAVLRPKLECLISFHRIVFADLVPQALNILSE